MKTPLETQPTSEPIEQRSVIRSRGPYLSPGLHLGLLTGLLSASLLSGCTSPVKMVGGSLHDGHLARSAWAAYEPGCPEVTHRHAFRDGFIDGYEAVCEGQSGRPPAIPPKKYRPGAHPSADDKARAAAWFVGFSRGSVRAHRDGYADHRKVMLSPVAHSAVNYDRETSFNGFYSQTVPVTGGYHPEFTPGPHDPSVLPSPIPVDPELMPAPIPAAPAAPVGSTLSADPISFDTPNSSYDRDALDSGLRLELSDPRP